MFMDINMFWAQLRVILASAAKVRVKMTLKRAQNKSMPRNIKLMYYYYYHYITTNSLIGHATVQAYDEPKYI